MAYAQKGSVPLRLSSRNEGGKKKQMKAPSAGANVQTCFCPLRLHHLFRR